MKPFLPFALFLILPILITARAETTDTPDPTVIAANSGNLNFLAQKIRDGQPIVAGFLGGSITQGSGASAPQYSYFNQTQGRLAAYCKASGSTLSTTLAAVGGTGTSYGVYRVGVQLLNKTPDLLVIEFAVNDLTNPDARDGMEGLVRQALAINPRMAIVLFYTANRKAITDFYRNHTSPPSVVAFRQVAAHYNLAQVEAGPRMLDLFSNGTIAEDAFYPDKTHPSNDGHTFYAKTLGDALVTALQNAGTPPAEPAPLKAPLGSGELAFARWLRIEPAEKKGAWEQVPASYYVYTGAWKTTEAGAMLTIPVRGTRIGLVCKDVSKAIVHGPGFDKEFNHKARVGGIPQIIWLYTGPAPVQGPMTIEIQADKTGKTEGEICAVAAIQPPEK